MERLELSHSACPNKVDIHPGRFTCTHTYNLSGNREITEWRCELCGAVVLVATKRTKEPTAALTGPELQNIMAALEYAKHVDSYLDEADEAIRVVRLALDSLGSP